MISLDPPAAGDASTPWKVTEPRSVASLSSTTVRLPSRDLEIQLLGSGISTPDKCSAYWKATSQALGAWTSTVRSWSAAVTIALAEYGPSKFLVANRTGLTHVLFSLQVWDIGTGSCLHVLRGHLNQIYCVSYDGIRIASGALDTHVRIWDPISGFVPYPSLASFPRARLLTFPLVGLA